MQKLLLELVWYIMTAVIVVAVMYPIWSNVASFPANWQNILFIVMLVTLTRYMFLLKYTFLARIQWLKVLLTLISFPCFFLVLDQFNIFRTNLDSVGIEYVTSGVPGNRALSMANYIKNEFTFFSIGTLIALVAFPVRMLISVWRLHNKGTV